MSNKVVQIIIALLALVGLAVLVEVLWGEKIHN